MQATATHQPKAKTNKQLVAEYKALKKAYFAIGNSRENIANVRRAVGEAGAKDDYKWAKRMEELWVQEANGYTRRLAIVSLLTAKGINIYELV